MAYPTSFILLGVIERCNPNIRLYIADGKAIFPRARLIESRDVLHLDGDFVTKHCLQFAAQLVLRRLIEATILYYLDAHAMEFVLNQLHLLNSRNRSQRSFY